MTANEIIEKTKATVAAKAGKVHVASRPQAYRLGQTEMEIKVGIYGHIGAGKTHALIGLLLNGERLAGVCTDFGGNGFRTVIEILRQIGREDLLENVYGVDLNSYAQFAEFVTEPKLYLPELDAFDPTVLFWEGATNFQINHLDEYILSVTSAESDSAMRDHGFIATRQDWAGMKRGTLRIGDKFFGLHGPSRRWHKVVTFHEDKPDVDDLTKKVQATVLLQGAAQSIFPAGFDLMVRAFVKENDKGEPEYFYRLKPGEKFAAKSRGFKTEAVEPADMAKLWRRLTNKHV